MENTKNLLILEREVENEVGGSSELTGLQLVTFVFALNSQSIK